MRFEKICKISFFTIMCLFLGLVSSNVGVFADIKVNTSRADEGIVDLSVVEGNNWFCTFWRGEKLKLTEEYVQILESINGTHISESSELYCAIDELNSQLIDMDIQIDSLVQIYQDGELREEDFETKVQEITSAQVLLDAEIVDTLIKFKDQCLIAETE